MLTALAQWRSPATGHRMWRGPLLGASVVGLCVGTLSVLPVGEALEERFGLWALFQLRGPVRPPPEVVLVAMPRDTGDRISVPREPPADDPCADLRVDETPPTHHTLGDVPERWSRCHHVELMRRLAAAKPAVVAVDVTFRPREDLGRTEDRALGRAIRALGNVVLTRAVKVRRAADGIPVEDGPVELSRDVAGAALGLAPMPLPEGAAGRFDQFWTFKDAGWATPSLPALALQAYTVDTYPALLSVLDRIAPQEAALLPRDSDALTRDGRLEVHMLHLRSIFLALPASTRKADALLSPAETGPLSAQTRKLRALLALYLRDSGHYLNAYGPPGTIRTIHIAEVLSSRPSGDKPDPLGLHGKAVFVGYADNAGWEMLEKFPTVYGVGVAKTSGVELVATAFGNLLDDSGLRPAPGWVHFILALAAGSLTTLACYATTSVAGTCAIVIGGAAYLGTAVLVFSRTAVWLPVFVPLALAMPLGYAYASGRKLMKYRRDRAALRQILNQFVPSDVVDVLARNASRLGLVKETTNAACVMTDVEGFTTLSTTLGPAQVADLLSEYFEAIFKPVASRGGFVSDLKGDSILAIWTDRDGDSAVRERVCHACLDLQAAVERFNAGHPSTPLPTRIGVNYGPVLLGPVGAHTHYEYRAVGDTVNTASRVEQLSKELGTRLLVTAPMMEGLQRFLVRDLGEFPLRGRRTPTRILELIARAEDAQPDQLELCSRFAEAKAALDAGELEQARLGFQLLTRTFPGDGPSGYFLHLLEQRP